MKYASAIAKSFNATIILMHVVESAPYSVTDTFNVIDRRRPVQTIASSLLASWEEEIEPRITVRTHLAVGFAYQEILKRVQKEQVDLIIMGTYGRTGLGHFLLGSVTEKVVRLATCPVLTVRLKGQTPKATVHHRERKTGAAL